MKINMNTQSFYTKNVQTKNAPAFNGAMSSYPRLLSRSAMERILDTSDGEIHDLLRHKSSKKRYFFELLVNKFSVENYYKPETERDAAETVFDIFGRIGKTKDVHLRMVDSLPFSVTTLKKIFELTKNKSSYMEFACDLNTLLAQQRYHNPLLKGISSEDEVQQRAQIIIDFLQSDNLKKYVSDFDRYEPFIKQNAHKSYLVSDLDELVNAKLYDENDYLEMELQNRMERAYKYPETEHFNLDLYKRYYSVSGEDFLNKIRFFANGTDEYFRFHDRTFMEMFRTTTDDNHKIRYNVIRKYLNSRQPVEDNTLEKILYLYTRMDLDKNVMELVKKIIAGNVPISLNVLLDVLENNSSQKLNAFYPNIKKIAAALPSELQGESINNELTRPLYKNSYCRAEQDRLASIGDIYSILYESKAGDVIDTSLSYMKWLGVKLTDMFTSNPFKNKSEATEVSLEQFLSEAIPSSAAKDVVKASSEIDKEVAVPHNEQPAESIPSQVEVPNNPIKEEKESGKSILEGFTLKLPDLSRLLPAHTAESSNSVMQKPKRRSIFSFTPRPISPQKLAVANDILEFVKTKLGPKMFTTQSHDYKVDATKLRLSFLPEIFSSIAETRKRDRAMGKLKINTSNKDAVVLYSLINGSNRSLVNYLLKKRDADGVRIFEVKEIIEILQRAEDEIRLAKKSNPNYRAKDKKAYYSEILRTKVQEFGKVKPLRKSKDTSVKKSK